MKFGINRQAHFIGLQKTITDSTATIPNRNRKTPVGVKPMTTTPPPAPSTTR